MENKYGDEFLGTTGIWKLLAKLSVPAMVGMFVNALYNVVDTIYIGRGVGALGIGALTITFPFQLIVMAVGMTIGVGAASLISRKLGSGERAQAGRAVGTAMSVSVITGALMMISGFLFLDRILMLFGASDVLIDYAREYLQVILYGIPFISFAMTSNNIVRAEGKAFVAMVSMLIGTVLNIILDPLFIFVLEMGIRGAAVATVISQIVSFSFFLVFFTGGRSSVKIRSEYLIPDLGMLGEMFTIGLPAFIRQAGGSILAVTLNNLLLVYGGELAISAYGIINRLLMFTLMPIFGIVQGFQPIAGYNYGSRQYGRVSESIRAAVISATALATVSFLIMMSVPRMLVGMFTTDPELIALSVDSLKNVIIAIPLVGLQIVGATFFQAVGKALPSLILGMLRQIILLIPLVIILPGFFGLKGIWAAFPAADVAASVVTVFWLIRELKQLGIFHAGENSISAKVLAGETAE